MCTHSAYQRNFDALKDGVAVVVHHLHHLAVMIPRIQNRADAQEHGLLHAQERHDAGKGTRARFVSTQQAGAGSEGARTLPPRGPGRSTPPPATASGAGPSVVDLVPSDTDTD